MIDVQSKKSLACILYRQAKQFMSKKQLQEVLFFDEETTDNWSIERCQRQYVIDQLEWMESDDHSWEQECNETWQEIELTKFFHICEVY